MIFVGAILLAVFVLPDWLLVPTIVLGAMVEVGETFFWLWYTRRGRAQVGAETLVGEIGVVAVACRPRGQVRVQGELWQARCDEGADPGERVRVSAREGLVLLVDRAA